MHPADPSLEQLLLYADRLANHKEQSKSGTITALRFFLGGDQAFCLHSARRIPEGGNLI
jgi:hypothetical protein